MIHRGLVCRTPTASAVHNRALRNVLYDRWGYEVRQFKATTKSKPYATEKRFVKKASRRMTLIACVCGPTKRRTELATARSYSMFHRELLALLLTPGFSLPLTVFPRNRERYFRRSSLPPADNQSPQVR